MVAVFGGLGFGDGDGGGVLNSRRHRQLCLVRNMCLCVCGAYVFACVFVNIYDNACKRCYATRTQKHQHHHNPNKPGELKTESLSFERASACECVVFVRVSTLQSEMSASERILQGGDRRRRRGDQIDLHVSSNVHLNARECASQTRSGRTCAVVELGRPGRPFVRCNDADADRNCSSTAMNV